MPWLPSHEAAVDPAPLRDEDGRLRRARMLLRQLPARDRLLLALRAQGLPYREIAAAASIQPASVGRLLARAAARWADAVRKDGHGYELLERRTNPGAR
jgi:DNA-directed RNA polymerase specialized sigma24 family protein